MRYSSVVLVSIAALSFAASALADPNLPPQFKVTCGDIAHKVPYDSTDVSGTLINPDFTGAATSIPSDQLTGYWTGGSGYTVTATLSVPELTGTYAAITTVFSCYFKYPSMTEMKCSSALQALPSVAGFNALTATLPIPMSGMISGSGSVSIRYSKDASKPGLMATRYYQNTRELQCQYSQ
jgi:hypothetical protein